MSGVSGFGVLGWWGEVGYGRGKNAVLGGLGPAKRPGKVRGGNGS